LSKTVGSALEKIHGGTMLSAASEVAALELHRGCALSRTQQIVVNTNWACCFSWSRGHYIAFVR